MAAEEWDPFKGSSGLMDDVDVTFANFRFGRNPSYKDQDGNLIVVAMVDFLADGETKDQILTIGGGWEVEDNGTRVVRESGDPKGFNNNTYLQTILNRALELDEDTMRKRYEDTGLAPQTAGYWEGFSFHGNLEEYTKGFGENASTGERLMPTVVLGWDAVKANGKAPAARKAPAKKAVAKKAVAPVAEVAEETGGLSGAALAAVKLQIRNIADECESFDEYVDRAFGEIAGIAEDTDVQALVEADGEGSIWNDAVLAAAD